MMNLVDLLLAIVTDMALLFALVTNGSCDHVAVLTGGSCSGDIDATISNLLGVSTLHVPTYSYVERTVDMLWLIDG